MSNNGHHLVLCDKINSGKSSFCLKLVDILKQEHIEFSGFITPPHPLKLLDGDKKSGHDFLTFSDGDVVTKMPFTRPTPYADSFFMFRYYFNKHAFKKASELNGSIFIMDEIGLLELDLKQGFYETLLRVISTSKLTLTVVREGLIEKLGAITNTTSVCFDLGQKTNLINTFVRKAKTIQAIKSE